MPTLGGFELLTPAGLWLAAALAPLVVLYILKVKRERRTLPSTWLWAGARRDLMARSPFQKLLVQLPLLLQALALLALALGLARPATTGRALLGDHVALIVDTSASMGALEGDPAAPTTRLALAQEAARRVLAGLTPGAEVLVVEAAREPRVAATLGRDRARARQAVDKLRANDVEGDLGAAVALATERLKDLGGDKRIVVLTDGALARDPEFVPLLPVEVVTVGAPADNAGIVRVDVRLGRDPTAGPESGAEELQAFLVVQNFGRAPRELYVTMRQDNASDVLASRKVLLAPGERSPVVLTFRPTPGDHGRGLVFDLAPHDALPADDTAYGRVPPGDKLPVVVASVGGSPWLERALASDPATEVRTGPVASLAGRRDLAGDTFVVVDGACPSFVPGGDLLVVNPPVGTCLGVEVGPALERPALTSWESGDPRLRFLSLDGVHVAKAHRLHPESPSQELVRTAAGAVVADASSPARRATIVGFDVGDSDWPLKASFVLFARNLLELARAERALGVLGTSRTGEPIRVRVPVGATRATVEPPRPPGTAAPAAPDPATSFEVRAGVVVVANPDRAGLYRIGWEGDVAGTMVLPVNLASERESDLARAVSIASGGGRTRSGTVPEGHEDWTYVLALVALAFVVFDVWYLTRKPRPRPLPVPRPPGAARAS